MYRFLLNIYNKVFNTATFSESTESKGSDSVIDFCCSPCQEHNIDQWAEFYCENCLKFYCGKCINLHGHLFGKHEMYGRGDTSKWPVPTEVKDFIQKCDLHEEQSIEMFCDDHSQLCCRKCVFLNHRQCAEVTLISELVKGPPPELQQLSRDIQSLHVELKKLQNNWDINIQSLKASYKKQLHEIGQTRQKINTILDEMEKTTMKELDARMTSLKASLKSDLDKIIKLKNETKQFGDAIHAIVDKGKEEIAFIASKKCLEKMKQSENFLKQNSVQIKSSLTFHADANVQQYLSKLSGLGKIAFVTKELVHLDDPDQVFTVQGKSRYDVSIPSDSLKETFYSALCVLAYDQILVADSYNCRVKLLNDQYNVVGHCDLYASPSDMCQITLSEVAIAVNKTHEVQFLSVNDGQLVKGRKLPFQHRCHSIAHNLQDLYLTSCTALYKYSMNGVLLDKLYEDTQDDNTVCKCAVSPSGDKIFITNHSQHKVLTLARDGTVLHTFSDPDLDGPFGVHVTSLGQVLVSGVYSEAIVQLDGKGKKKLATIAIRNAGLNAPQSVCYNKSTASIVVGLTLWHEILVFKVQ